MTTSRPRAALGVVLGLALAATAVWLALLLARGDQPHQATQPPPTPAAATSPTETTAAPAFTRDGAVAGLRILVRQRLEAFNTLNESTLRSIYTADCRLADGRPCLKDDLATLNDLKRKNHRLLGYPTVIQEVRIVTWEPQTRTAVLRLAYEALPAKIVDSEGDVVETIPGSKQVIDQVNLVWSGGRWQQAWAGSIEES
jgi:hypothetical protein